MFGFTAINSENCWGKLYNPDEPDPSAKIYRNKCCILCKPGEYLNKDINSCVNCKAGHACNSTLLRKNSQILT